MTFLTCLVLTDHRNVTSLHQAWGGGGVVVMLGSMAPPRTISRTIIYRLGKIVLHYFGETLLVYLRKFLWWGFRYFMKHDKYFMHILDFNITWCKRRNTQIIRIRSTMYQYTFYRVASENILLKIILQYCVGNSCQLADHLTSLNSYLISLLRVSGELRESCVDTCRVNWNIKTSRTDQ